jgi:uncharacterized protein (TIGR02217 family)
MAGLPVYYWNPDYSMVESIEFNTEITMFESGVEQRRKRRANGLRTFSLTYDLLDQSEMDDLWDFFIARAGRFDAFLYRDFLNDYLIEKEVPTGTQDGLNTDFSLSKKFIVEPSDATFDPVATPVTIYKNGVLLVEGPDFTVSYGTGEITFAVGPQATDNIVATYEFYYLVRFLEDKMSKDLFEYIVYRTGVKLRELNINSEG